MMFSAVADSSRPEIIDDDLFYGPEENFDVSNYPSFNFSMKQVQKAGKVIAGPLDGSDPNLKECPLAFKIANNWRDAHAYPMRSMRLSIIYHLRNTLKADGITAARLKRMQAIRRKLRRIGLHLNQLQDLGGCRAIVGSVEDVEALVEALRSRVRHVLIKDNDYIAEPKSKDGYRSRHLIFSFRGRGEKKAFNDRRIEVQIRTALQHSWATAVEAVGLFRKEDLKGNKGDDRWLLLFKLMSAEFAEIERCAVPEGVPPHNERVKEIKRLNAELQASETLENLSNAVRWTEDAIKSDEQPQYYLIKYDNATSQVRVEPFFNAIRAVQSYDQAEVKDNQTGENTTNVVLVEGGKVHQLRQAYPNYFGDVAHFKKNLNRICTGKAPKDYELIPQERVSQPRDRGIDLSWLNRRGGWR